MVTGDLWVVGSDPRNDMQLGMMAATSPSICALPEGGWQVAFQANTGDLWVVGSDPRNDMQLGMMAATSPSICALPEGGWQVAFQANTGDLWVVGSDPRNDMQLGMMAATSPSICALPEGGWQVAFQANTGDLWVVGSDPRNDMQLGMMAATSPSICALPEGGWQVAFQANTGDLWVVGSDPRNDMQLGMMAATSPSICALPGGGWQVAFQANTGDLWVVGSDPRNDMQLGMMAGTSPSICALPEGGWQVAFQANTGDLWVVGSDPRNDMQLGMMAATSPSICALPGGGWQVAFQANTGAGWVEQGPGPLAADTGLGYRKVAGAIQAVAVDPADRDRVFVASVGGGVWRSMNAVSAVDPTWVPLTDSMPSLSMSAVAISPFDRDTIFAGCGDTSHGLPLVGPSSGPLLGLLSSSDGGRTWIELARDVFAGHTVTRILPSAQPSEWGHLLMVATLGAGLQRSPDNGQTWQRTSPAGDDVFDVVAEPGNPSRMYAAGSNGMFRSDDGGDKQWTAISLVTGDLWVVGSDPRNDMQLGMMAATSPSICALPGGGWQVAFQANTGDLWVVGSDPRNDMQLGMMAATSPSICALPEGGWQVAFQANTGDLWVVGSDPRNDMQLGMMAATSPSICALPEGGWQVAFQANTGDLWVVGSDPRNDMQLGMMAGTSPSICALPEGGWQVAFQANTGDLWVVGSDPRNDMQLGMMAATSPSICALPEGGWQVAFQANTGDLWVVGSDPRNDMQLGMMAGTSPSICALPEGGWQVAFQANTGDLWVVGSDPRNDMQLGMMAGTSPSICALPGGGWQVAFQGGSWPVTANVRLSVTPTTDSGGAHRVYAAVDGITVGPVGGEIHRKGLFVSRDAGQTWGSMGSPPSQDPAAAPRPVSPIAASPLQPETVFTDVDDGSHWIARSVSGTGADTQWTRVDGPGAQGTSAHTDGRDAAFSADPNVLFETDDGGIYRLINVHGLPDAPARHWEEAVGDIRIAEFYALAYDSVHHIMFGAAQDNSIPQQTSPGDIVWLINERSYGDGIEVGIDNTTVPGASIHYSSQQNLFQFIRRTYTSTTSVSGETDLGLVIDGTGGKKYNQVEGALRDDGGLGTVRFNQSWVLNDADPTRILIGTDFLYESFDRGDTFTSLGGLARNAKNEWIPANPVGTVTAYAYGHATNPDVMYVGAGGSLLLRPSGQGLPTVVDTYPGSTPLGITLAGDGWQHAYILDDQMRVWQTRDATATGGGWTNLTGNLGSLSSDLRTICALRPSPGASVLDTVLVGGYRGVFASTIDPATQTFGDWQRLGTGFPNAVVTSLSYAARDDVLAVGTYGRAAWLLRNVLNRFPPNTGPG